jgi:hypothetical protein
MGVDGFILSNGRANWNRVPVFYLPSVSYITGFPAGGLFCLPPACLLVFAISSNLKMETICSSETSVETRRTTRRHIPEDDTLHNHRCGNLKSYKFGKVLRKRFIWWYKVLSPVCEISSSTSCQLQQLQLEMRHSA